MTAGLWFRVILSELCAIRPNEISWFIGRVRELSHGGLLGMDTKPPAGVSTDLADDGANLRRHARPRRDRRGLRLRAAP